VFSATTSEEECQRALAHLEQVIALEGPATIAALVLESVPGTAGIMVPPPGYLAGVRELTRRHGIVLILDEVMAGFGRTGTWFGYEVGGDAEAVDPDLVTFAKGVNSGYVPLGGVAISDEIAATFADRSFPGGLTYSGHPLACAAAVATITAMEEEDVVGGAARIGAEVLGPELRAIADRHDVVGEVRGTGVFWALELVRDRATREPVVPAGATGAANQPMADFTAACLRRGLLPFVNGNRTHVVPPCTISAAEARTGLALLDEALGEAFA
jgi:taurine--2-oxoglutarate transaminase